MNQKKKFAIHVANNFHPIRIFFKKIIRIIMRRQYFKILGFIHIYKIKSKEMAVFMVEFYEKMIVFNI